MKRFDILRLYKANEPRVHVYKKIRSSEIIGDLKMGKIILADATDEDYVRVPATDGNKGWVNKCFLTRVMERPEPEFESRSIGHEIVDEAWAIRPSKITRSYISHLCVYNVGAQDFDGPITVEIYDYKERIASVTVTMLLAKDDDPGDPNFKIRTATKPSWYCLRQNDDSQQGSVSKCFRKILVHRHDFQW